MIDTVQLKHCFIRRLSDEELRELGAVRIDSRRNRIFALNPKYDRTLPRLTLIITPDGIMHLSAECSIPKMLFGHNSRLPSQTEIFDACEKISRYVKEATGLDFDAATATVSIVHFAVDIDLGEQGAYEAINRLTRIKMKGLAKLVYDDTTVYFNRKSKEIRIYPKFQEVVAKGKMTMEALEAARGNLRFEYCLLNKYGVDSHVKRLGLKDSKAISLLNTEVSDRLFLELFREIDFPCLLTNDKSNLQMLKDRFTGRKAMTLDGFLNTVDQFGPLFYKDPSHGFKKGAYYRAVSDCRKAGVWRTGGRFPE